MTLPSHNIMVRNILSHLHSASEEQAAEGVSWYPSANRICAALAEGHGYTLPQVASAMAHLSPREMWVRNVQKTVQLVELGDTYGLRLMVDNAKRALTHHDPLSTFSKRALKTSRFARNILGDHTVVTVDMWAILAATGVRQDRISGAEYLAIEAAYQQAGQGFYAPAELQAIVWVVIRGRAN